MTNENNIDIPIKMSVKPRQTGLELLRIIAIFLITCVHMLNYGGF